MSSIPGVFISTVSSEFAELRERLRAALDRSRWKVWTQENLSEFGQPTLEKLDDSIRASECVIHFVGRAIGSCPRQASLDWLRATYPDLLTNFTELAEFAESADHTLTLTQWEAWLGLFHGAKLLVMTPEAFAEDLAHAPEFEPQRRHLALLKHRECRATTFTGENQLVEHLQSVLSALKDKLLHAYTWPPKLDFEKYLRLRSNGFVGRDWLFRRLDQWADQGSPGDDRKPMLLLGGFGIGKTAAMAKLLEHWKRRAVVSHFCQYDNDRTLSPGEIVRNIAAQLADVIPAYRRRIEAEMRLQEMLEDAVKDPARALRYAVLTPLNELGAARPSQDCFVIIDALDESVEIKSAPGATGITLVELVVDESVPAPHWMRVLITSRPVGVVAPGTPLRSRFEVIEFSAQAQVENLEDIDLYIEQRAASEPRIGEFLKEADRSASELARFLTSSGDGRFLLVKSVLNDIVAGRIMASQYEQMPVQMDEFYEHTFRNRVWRGGFEIPTVRTMFGLIAVAREPLPPRSIATILGLEPDKVRLIFNAFSGLLVTDAQGGITFAHFSLEHWLRGRYRTEGSAPGEFEIEPERSIESLLAYCKSMAGRELEEAREFRGYLERFGIGLLTEKRQFDSALELLHALRNEQGIEGGEHSIDPRELRRQVDLIVERLKAHWIRIDAAVGARKTSARAALDQTDPAHLRDLLLNKDYETGKYVPVIRSLIECHPGAWQGIKEELLAGEGEAEENDLVFRHDAGVAYAQAWHAATPERRLSLMAELEAMAADASGSDSREIAGYALKFFCERTDRRSWWGAVLPRLKALAVSYAHSESPTDRMVAGEFLLALAIQGERVTQWFTDGPGDVPFWNPYWQNQGADIDAIHALEGVESPPVTGSPAQARGLARCKAQNALAAELRRGLSDCDYFRAGSVGAGFSKLLTSFAAQQNDIDALDGEAVGKLARALKGRFKDELFQFIKLLMLHPLWNVTERAATLVSELVKRDQELIYLIEKLAQVDPELWRIRYGAVDAAYNYGSYDNYELFFKLLIQCGRDESCRVRGICIDDFSGWVADAGDDSLARKLAEPAMTELIRHWVETADDSWLLEYLHELFRDLRDRKGFSAEELAALIGPTGKVSRYLVDDRFYELEAPEFTQRIERIRQAEWRGLSETAP